jgi:hypothetical protein
MASCCYFYSCSCSFKENAFCQGRLFLFHRAKLGPSLSVTNLCLEWVQTRSDSTVQQQETTKHKDRQEVMRDAIAYVRTKRTAREVRMPQCFYS